MVDSKKKGTGVFVCVFVPEGQPHAVNDRYLIYSKVIILWLLQTLAGIEAVKLIASI